MATRKPKEEIAEAEELEQELNNVAVEAEEEKPYDAWSDMVDVLIPRYRPGEDQTVRVKVNDRETILPRDGKMHKVARPWAEILMASIAQEEEANEFMEGSMTGEREIARM